MSTQMDKLQLEETRLRDRIETFYSLVNEQQWEQCYEFIDPTLRDGHKVALDAYVETLSSFFAAFGPLEDLSVTDLTLHLDVKSELYDDRDFAHGSVVWRDQEHRLHTVQQRWVKAADGRWYTRMVGLL